MSKVTITYIKERAANHLGDPTGDKFSNNRLTPFFESAWEELYEHILASQLQYVEIQHPYTLPANTKILTPETAGISNLAGIKYIEERPENSASSEKYIEMDRVERLSQRDPDVLRLYQYRWSNNTLYFIGCTNGVDLRINYFASAVAPTKDNTLCEFDGAQNWLSWRLAAIAGPPMGHTEGPRLEGEANKALDRWIDPKVRAQQVMQVQPKAFHAGRQVPFREGRPPHYNN